MIDSLQPSSHCRCSLAAAHEIQSLDVRNPSGTDLRGLGQTPQGACEYMLLCLKHRIGTAWTPHTCDVNATPTVVQLRTAGAKCVR